MEEVKSTPDPQAGPNKNRNMIIGVVVAILVCCCCAAAAIAGYYAYQAYTQTQQALEDLQNFEIPTGIPFDPQDPNSPEIPLPGFDSSGEVPEGGLADEQTRITAWFSLQVIGPLSGCNAPTAQGTAISVTQQPDSSGAWVEEWDVNCGDGTSKPFNVKFTPQGGIVNVEVEFPQP
jgi:hypothetical protein